LSTNKQTIVHKLKKMLVLDLIHNFIIIIIIIIIITKKKTLSYTPYSFI